MADLTRTRAARTVLVLLAVLGLTLALPRPAVAEDYAGDLKTVQVGMVDEAGKPVTRIARGTNVTVRYTITNTEKFPVKVTGVDSQAVVSGCADAFTRATRRVDPHQSFPIYLKPGEKSTVLSDEKFSLGKDAPCRSVRITRWKGNVLAEKVDAIPTATASSLPTSATTMATTALPTRAGTTTQPTGGDAAFDWTGLAAVGAGTVVLTGLLLALFGRKRG